MSWDDWYKKILTPFLLATLALGGCGSGSDGSNSGPDGGSSSSGSGGSSAQDADAGGDHIWYAGATLTLDAGSGDGLRYQWSLDSKPFDSSASLSNADTQQASLTPDVAGIYKVSLEVSDGTGSSSDSAIITVADWLINNSERSVYITDGGSGVLVNVQNVSAGDSSITVSATGIPNYSVLMAQDNIDNLNSRPKTSSDFTSGATTAKVGDTVLFGQSIGYNASRGPGCDLGYWPPGPACPSSQNKRNSLPLVPEATSDNCSTSLDEVGIMLNGASIFNWSDGQSYNGARVWNNLAPVFEQYDVDICMGHAQRQGNYHHHMYSGCVKELLDDDGSAHSPLYGFAADGYPIYGPYSMQGVLAKSAWVKRDYSANSASGCGADGERSCQLVDQYDLSKGTSSVSAGPDTSATVTTQSGNPISAESGIYFEDYYYDASLTAQGNGYLDEHNGHEHGDYGYHYHITAENVDGKLEPVFPYQVGPTFYGKLPDNTFAVCGQ